MEKVRLGDICFKKTSNIAQKELEGLSGVYPIYGASGMIKTVDFYHQENDYVAVVKDGAGIGRTMYLPAKSSVIGTLQYLIPKENINTKYLYYAVKSRHLEKYYTGAAIPHIYFNDYQNEPILLHDEGHQRIIVSVLDSVQKIIDNRKIEIEKLDELIKARFVEMFGDRWANNLGWQQKPLKDCAIFYNGKPHEQVVDEYGDYVLVTSKFIASDQREYRKTNTLLFPLQRGDICMVMSDVPNGRALAKCVMITEDNRYTLNQRICCLRGYTLNPVFFKYALNRHEYFLSFNDGDSQTNLRKDDLLACPIILPPKGLQDQFATFVAQVDKSKSIERNFAHFGRKLYHISSEMQFILEA